METIINTTNRHQIPMRLIHDTLIAVNQDLGKRLPPGLFGTVLAADSLKEASLAYMKGLRGTPRGHDITILVEPVKDSNVGETILTGIEMTNPEGDYVGSLTVEFLYRKDGGPLRLTNASLTWQALLADRTGTDKRYLIAFTHSLDMNNKFGMSLQRNVARAHAWGLLLDTLTGFSQSGSFDLDSVRAMDQLCNGIRSLI